MLSEVATSNVPILLQNSQNAVRLGQPLYLSLANIDAQRLSIRQRVSGSLFTLGRLVRPEPSSATGGGNSQQERN